MSNTTIRTKRPLYQEIAALLQAIRNCKSSNNTDWEGNHTDRLNRFLQSMPSGSGFDNGTKLIDGDCEEDKLVFETAFHHMNESGCYDGWTDHRVIVTPSFDGIDIRVTGRNRNDIKDYIHETFHMALTELVEVF